MRLLVLSDLHVEFRPFAVAFPDVDVDVVVLAGDIGVGLGGLELAARFAERARVIYVFGNHEFFGHSHGELLEAGRELAARHGIDVLEDDEVTIGGVRFLGASLWTDFRLYEPRVPQRVAMDVAGRGMLDYDRIRRSKDGALLVPQDTLDLHVASRRFLASRLAEGAAGPTVVVTHHGPAPESVPPRHRGDILSAAFVSDLGELIEDSPVDLWIHGHTHGSCDYRIGGTRVLSNQRGYPREDTGGFDPNLCVEIPGS